MFARTCVQMASGVCVGFLRRVLMHRACGDARRRMVVPCFLDCIAINRVFVFSSFRLHSNRPGHRYLCRVLTRTEAALHDYVYVQCGVYKRMSMPSEISAHTCVLAYAHVPMRLCKGIHTHARVHMCMCACVFTHAYAFL